MELTVENIPLLVAGVSFKCTQNPRSCSRFHLIPRALSVGSVPVIKSWFFTPCLLSCSRIIVSTSLSLHIWILWGNILLLYTFFSHHLPVLMQLHKYLLTLASHPHKSFFSKFLQHHYYIFLDCLMLFFWEYSYCSLVEKYHQKHERKSHDLLYFYWRHCLPAIGITRNFNVFYNLHLVEYSLFICHYSNTILSKSDKYSTPTS